MKDLHYVCRGLRQSCGEEYLLYIIADLML